MRIFIQLIVTSPYAIALERMVHFAKQLIQETRVPMAEVALTAVFGSVRRFNETFLNLFGRPPSALRRKSSRHLPVTSLADVGVTLRLRYRAPYDWAAMLAHLRVRGIEGVE